MCFVARPPATAVVEFAQPVFRSVQNELVTHFDGCLAAGDSEKPAIRAVNSQDSYSFLTADEVEDAVDRLEGAIRRQHPEIRHIFLETESVPPEDDRSE